MHQETSQGLWFGVYGKEYTGNEPAFFDDDFPWKKTLEDNFDIIKSELAPLMAEDSTELQPYFDEPVQFPIRSWKMLVFLGSGKSNDKIVRHFPQLMRVLHQIPGLVSAVISLLEPNSRILPHTGETNGVFRVHLGLCIPAGLPGCGFRVKDETRPWREGGVLVFLDAFPHEAFNDTSTRRYVLVLDIVRPEFMLYRKRICIMSLSMLSLNWVVAKLPRLLLPKRKGIEVAYPGWFISAVLLPFRMFWYVAWPLVRK